MTAPARRGAGIPGALVAPALVGALLVLLPLLGLVVRTPWRALGDLLGEPEAVEALRLSLVSASAAAVLATVTGGPLGWIFARSAHPGARALRPLVLLPLVLPPVVAGVALLATFGRRGILGDGLDALGVHVPFTTLAVVLAQAFVALPFVVLTVETGVRNADVGLEEAAAACGASRWFTFRHVSLPLLGPSVVAAALLAWARALGEFGATITFAGNVAGRTRTLPLAVVTALQRDTDTALALSALLVAVSLLVLVGLRDRWLGGR
ncbi:MAG TPA: ABC transporter permease [Acidimicrobiales bacterium]|nr:ABC transporter permease [Acidimicrobiales bacterium]